jgi:hypothetical protein
MPDIIIMGNRGVQHHAQPLLEVYGDRILIEQDWRPSVILNYKPNLVITFEASNAVRGLGTAEMVRANVASLLIMDGIQEWRNSWTRSRQPVKRPLNQPVLAHKVACLGRMDVRLYESWGNVGKCEIVGAYRLDPLVQAQRPMRTRPVQDRPLRLLVMTARTPGFTPDELETTFRSLADLRDELKDRSDIQVVWRVTRGLHKRLNVKNSFTESTGVELRDVLAEVDAVITTPSTAMLEGMLLGHPVALLDYHNVPHYVQAAWSITAREHIQATLDELVSPPLERMLFQDYCLHEALSCRKPALARTVDLIDRMIAIKKEHDATGQGPLVFPHRILEDPDEAVSWPSPAFNLEELYPHHPVYGNTELVTMQSELDAAILTVEQLHEQVNVLTERLHHIPGYLLAKKVTKSLQKYFA